MIQRIGLLATAAIAITIVMSSASHGIAEGRLSVGAIKLAEASQMQRQKAISRRTAAPRTAPTRAPRSSRPKVVSPKQVVTPKAVRPRRVVTPKAVIPKRVVAPKTVAPKSATPKAVSPTRLGLRAIGDRSTGRIVVRGRNYTVWRGAHRVRHDSRWATLAAISALSVVFFGGAPYYPYAYISATGPYCEGVTDDGCVLQWEEVPTLEGPRVFQCVAYCPWQ